jgi:hypothetical protein
MPETETAAHPLMQGDISWIKDWTHWKKLWSETTLAEFRHSLLHFGFDVAGGGGDRICFYLELADGCLGANPDGIGAWDWQSTYSPRIRTALGEFQHPSFLRAFLGRKAYEMLCLRYFKNTAENRFNVFPSWVPGLLAEPVVDKLLWFFRLKNGHHRPNIANLGSELIKEHHAEIARKFVVDFSKFAWIHPGLVGEFHDGYYGEKGEKLGGRLRTARPQCAELLFLLGEHSFLLSKDCKLEPEAVARLKSFVMNEELHDSRSRGRSRKPETLADAVLSRIFGASLVLTLEAMNEERLRQEAVAAAEKERETAENARREAEHKLEQLARAPFCDTCGHITVHSGTAWKCLNCGNSVS